MHWEAGSFERMGTSIYYIHKNPWTTLVFMGVNILVNLLLQLLVKSLIYTKLVTLLDQYKLQVEMQAIIHNLDSVVITC